MRKILVVDDEPELLQMVQNALFDAGFWNVHTAATCAQAVSFAKSQPVALFLLDVNLPDGNGFMLYKTLRESSNAPVIFLTARGEADDKVRGFDLGADDYIVKPFEVLELLVRVEKVLERTGRQISRITVGTVEINLNEHQVTRDGQEVSLKPLEYDLLVLLAKNKNMAFTREQLLNQVWGSDYLGETRTVDVHIGQLRKKLELFDVIKTIPKIGYRLED